MCQLELDGRVQQDEGGRYRLVREVGGGAMGVVWLVYDGLRGQHVTLKRVRVPSSNALLRLKREFRVIAPLRHRHLVRVYDLCGDERGVFFTMEYVEGHDLQHVLDQELPSLAGAERLGLALDVARQVLPALAYLHERGIVHRDLKPSNLMLASDGTLKLIDFGLLAASGEERVVSLDRLYGGTPPYAPPEQSRGDWPSPASDMYSLGVLLLRVAFGRLPDRRGGVAAGPVGRALSHEIHERRGPELVSDFATYCNALAHDEPRLRPDARFALSSLPGLGNRSVVPLRRATPSAPAGCAAPVAEGDDRAWLADWRERVADGRFQAAVVEGPARSGKTVLLRWMRDFASDLGGLVLFGRGRAQEHVAYNVLDAAIDALAAVLLETPMDAELAGDVALASKAFPVLAGEHVANGEPTGLTRADAFDAVIRILESLAGMAGVYLFIDDFHRADAESLAFLERLLDRRPAAVGVVATVRLDAGARGVESWLDGQPAIARRRLTPSARPARGAARMSRRRAPDDDAPTIR